MPLCGNALCINNETIKLHTHSDSFRCAKQRKGGRVRSFGGFCVVANQQKSVQFFFQEPPYFFPRVVLLLNET